MHQNEGYGEGKSVVVVKLWRRFGPLQGATTEEQQKPAQPADKQEKGAKGQLLNEPREKDHADKAGGH
jgi:hypothetical protein